MWESAEIASNVMTNCIPDVPGDPSTRCVGSRYPRRMTDGPDPTTYFAADFALDAERDRLSILEKALDPITKGHLERLAFASTTRPRRCLEMGAGGGSIARWLADRCSPGGTVVAADVDTRFLVG